MGACSSAHRSRCSAALIELRERFTPLLRCIAYGYCSRLCSSHLAHRCAGAQMDDPSLGACRSAFWACDRFMRLLQELGTGPAQHCRIRRDDWRPRDHRVLLRRSRLCCRSAMGGWGGSCQLLCLVEWRFHSAHLRPPGASCPRGEQAALRRAHRGSHVGIAGFHKSTPASHRHSCNIFFT